MADGIAEEAGTQVDRLMALGEAIAAGARMRAARLASLDEDWYALEQGVAAAGQSLPSLIAAVIAVVCLALTVFWLSGRFLSRRSTGAIGASVGPALAASVAAMGLAFAFGAAGYHRRSLLLFALAMPLAMLARDAAALVVLGRSHASVAPNRLADFVRLIGLAFAWGVVGVASSLLLRGMQAGAGLRDLVGTVFVALPVTAIAIEAYWRHGAGVGVALARGWSGSSWLRRIGPRWPKIAVALIVLAFVVLQVAATISAPLPGLAFLLTLAAALLWPHLDVALARWAAAGLDGAKIALPLVAARRTARPALVILIAAGLIGIWGPPVAALTGFDVRALARSALGVAGILLFGAYLWNLVGAGIDRAMAGEEPAGADGDGGHAPRSRLGTLLPLVGGAARIAIVVLTALTVLLAVGVNVWPLVTGLSVFGLAIGFGSQTLVKDIVSGIFFLADDAFRLGEYIESSGAKGTVEKISIRSVSLRHPRGALATIPYGQIGKIQNFSRDWVIEKLAFRVAFDTDVDKVKKLFKQIGQDLAADPELAPDVIEPFKSQGIGAVEDNTLILRGKFKSRAGQQFAMRKAVLAAVQKAFRENGIQTVPRPLPQA